MTRRFSPFPSLPPPPSLPFSPSSLFPFILFTSPTSSSSSCLIPLVIHSIFHYLQLSSRPFLLSPLSFLFTLFALYHFILSNRSLPISHYLRPNSLLPPFTIFSTIFFHSPLVILSTSPPFYCLLLSFYSFFSISLHFHFPFHSLRLFFLPYLIPFLSFLPFPFFFLSILLSFHFTFSALVASLLS